MTQPSASQHDSTICNAAPLMQQQMVDHSHACRTEKPPRVEPGTGDPTFKLFVTMFKDEVKVFRDVSGTSLHKRGYRGRIHKAALNEAAAAGILLLAGWPAIAERGASRSALYSVQGCPC